MKVGVLFYKCGQTHETSMLSNKDGSAEFNQFLNFIGCRIQLQGFDGYSGDLDVSDKHLDGRFLVYTEIAVESNNGHKCECVQHVSTLLNYMANNKQQIDGKRYIVNDNVVIVFQQPGAEPYKCDTIISEPNHAIINVTPIKKQEALMMIKNRTEQLRMVHVMKEQKKKEKEVSGEQEADNDGDAGAGMGIEIEGQEDVFLRKRPRGSGGDEPQVEGGFSDLPETDILVTYRSTTPQQQPSSSSSEHSPSPVPIFDEDLTYRSYDNARPDIDINESANYSDNVDEMASSESDRNSFVQKLFAVEQSTWIGPRNKIRFEGMRRQEMLRIVKKLGYWL
ncbi:MAG: hypothetical protein EZS28_035965 [Streblomastix strix]|uniref:Rap-GAP domain-containing protein n=1 Tax=Streblomastix strix TaxID=222440 RepID=A0A5J4UD33_9EUKA|nr:MAG: hypothetical protein EZS28_035965 [Streblomastix strix]